MLKEWTNDQLVLDKEKQTDKIIRQLNDAVIANSHEDKAIKSHSI